VCDAACLEERKQRMHETALQVNEPQQELRCLAAVRPKFTAEMNVFIATKGRKAEAPTRRRSVVDELKTSLGLLSSIS